MTTEKTKRLGYSDQGDRGQPGSGYVKFLACVTVEKPGYQLDVRHVWGSHQGYLEEHGRVERKYRARSIDELMRVGIAEVRQEDEEVFDGATKNKLIAAIREACFEADDKAKEDRRMFPEIEHDAHLIAMAPEMLEALHSALDILLYFAGKQRQENPHMSEDDIVGIEDIRNIERIITKAERRG